MNLLTKTMLRDMGREMYLKSISVWLSPSMRLARTFAEMKDIPKDILKSAEDIYESQFKDIVDRKVDATMKFNAEMRRLYPGKNVLRPRPPMQIRISQPSVQSDIITMSQTRGVHRWRVLNPGDGRTCSRCREWIGRTVTDADGSVQEWKASGALHPNCRCSLYPLDEPLDIQQSAEAFVNASIIAYHEEPAQQNVVII